MKRGAGASGALDCCSGLRHAVARGDVEKFQDVRFIADLAHRAGNFALDQAGIDLPARLGDRYGRQQLARVGMLGVFENVLAVADFHDLPQVHHGNPVADFFDYGHVVRDEQVRQAALGLQGHQQVNDLRLDRHVKRRHRFVGDH